MGPVPLKSIWEPGSFLPQYLRCHQHGGAGHLAKQRKRKLSGKNREERQ